jgi:hypothetical protein
MNHPSVDLLALLVSLHEDQEGVVIKYKIEDGVSNQTR